MLLRERNFLFVYFYLSLSWLDSSWKFLVIVIICLHFLTSLVSNLANFLALSRSLLLSLALSLTRYFLNYSPTHTHSTVAVKTCAHSLSLSHCTCIRAYTYKCTRSLAHTNTLWRKNHMCSFLVCCETVSPPQTWKNQKLFRHQEFMDQRKEKKIGTKKARLLEKCKTAKMLKLVFCVKLSRNEFAA